MQKRIILVSVVILATVCIFGVFGLGVKEDKVYSVSNDSNFEKNYIKPHFLNDENYSYLPTGGGSYISHDFTMKGSGSNYGSGKVVIEKLDSILGKKITYMDIVEKFNLPTNVTVAEENGYFHLNLYYDEVQLYFGVQSQLVEVRFHSDTNYKYMGKITFGSTLEEVLEFLPVKKVVEGEKINFVNNNTLYKNIPENSHDGKPFEGYHYVEYKDKGLRIFFLDNKVNGLYVY